MAHQVLQARAGRQAVPEPQDQQDPEVKVAQQDLGENQALAEKLDPLALLDQEVNQVSWLQFLLYVLVSISVSVCEFASLIL